MLPTQRTALVEMTRWSCNIIASAPPAHRAFTTAWTSCWWTTRSSPVKPLGHRGQVRVVQRDGQGRAADRLGPGGERERRTGSVDRLAPDGCRRPAACVSASTERRSASTRAVETADLALLGPDQVREAGVAGGPQVGAVGDLGAGREQHAGQRERDGHEQPPAPRHAAPPTASPSPRGRDSPSTSTPPLCCHYANRRARVQGPQEGRLHAAAPGLEGEPAQRPRLRLDHGRGFVIGLAWIVTFYVSGIKYPIPFDSLVLEPGHRLRDRAAPASSWPPAGAEPPTQPLSYPQSYPRPGDELHGVIPALGQRRPSGSTGLSQHPGRPTLAVRHRQERSRT